MVNKTISFDFEKYNKRKKLEPNCLIINNNIVVLKT